MGKATRSPKQRVPVTPQNGPRSNKKTKNKMMTVTFRNHDRSWTCRGMKESHLVLTRMDFLKAHRPLCDRNPNTHNLFLEWPWPQNELEIKKDLYLINTTSWSQQKNFVSSSQSEKSFYLDLDPRTCPSTSSRSKDIGQPDIQRTAFIIHFTYIFTEKHPHRPPLPWVGAPKREILDSPLSGITTMGSGR